MAQRLTTTTFIDVLLKSGKVNTAEFNRQMEAQLQQALAKLPGVGATIFPNIKIDPKFDARKVSESLRGVLTDPKVKAQLTEKQLETLQKQVLKYSQALESLGQVGSKLRTNRATSDFVDKIASGQAKFSDATQSMQKNILAYRDSLVQLDKIYGDIARKFTQIRDIQAAPIAPSVKRELDSLSALAGARTRQINQAQTSIDTILAGRATGDIGPLQVHLEQLTKQRDEYQKQAAQIREEIGPSRINIGALIDPHIERTRAEITRVRAALDNTLKETERTAAKQRELAIKQRQAAETVDKLLPQLGTRGALQQALKGAPLSDLLGLRAAIKEERTALRAAKQEGSQRYSDLFTADKRIAELERRLTRQATAPERLLAERDRAVQKLESLLFKGKAQYRDIPLEVRRGLRAGTLEGISPDVLRTAQAGYQRQLNLIRDRIRENGDLFSHLSARQKQWIKDITKSLKSAQEQIQLELKARRTVTDPVKDFNIQRGRALSAEFKGRYQELPRAEIPFVREYLKDQQARLGSYLAGLDPKLPGNQAKIDAGVQQLSKYREQITELGHAAAYTHPLLTQVGRTLVQFAKYAIGYAALYKITQGFQALGSAAVRLEDNLKQIQAITGSFNTDITVLNEVIKKTAVSTAFSLDEISGAVQTIAQAGVSLKDIPKTVQAVANLATATGSSLQVAADVITTAQHVWDNLDPETISNRVAQAVNVSKLAVQDLQTIFSLGASFAESSNISLDQLLGQITVLANRGVRRSTIGTGLSQLYQELFSPDKKFSEFLSRQYKRVGETVSPEQAAGRFAAFREGQDPVLEALQELKRIGADQVGVISELRRAVDTRSFRALSPALRGIDDLPFETARLRYAPTAAEGARTALDSLGKAAKNLADTLEAASATALTPFFGSLTEATKSVTEFIAALDRTSQRASDTPGADSSALQAAISVGIAAGLAAASKAPSPFLKAGAFLATAATVGTGSYFGSKQLTEATGSTLPSDILSTIASLALLRGLNTKRAALGVSGAAETTAVEEAVRRNPLTGAVIGGAAAESAKAATAAGSLVGHIKNFAGNVKVITGTFRDIVSYLVVGSAIYGGVQRATQPDKGLSVQALVRRQAQQEQDRQARLELFQTYLPQPAGKPETDKTRYGQQVLLEERLVNFKKQLEQTLQVSIKDEFEALDLVEAVRRASSPETRSRLIDELKAKTGSKLTEVNQELLAEVLSVSGSLAGGLASSGEVLSDISRRIAEAQGPLSEEDTRYKEVLDELSQENARYASVISGFNKSSKDVLEANREFIKRLQQRNKDILDDLHARIQDVNDFINVLKTTAPDSAQYQQAQSQLRSIIQDGFRTFGLRFAQHAQDIINQMSAAALQEHAVDLPGLYYTRSTPEQRQQGKSRAQFVQKQTQTEVDTLRTGLRNFKDELTDALKAPVKNAFQEQQKATAQTTIKTVDEILNTLPNKVSGVFVDAEQEGLKRAVSLYDQLVREGKIQPDSERGQTGGRINQPLLARRRKQLTEETILSSAAADKSQGGGGPTRRDFIGGAEYNKLNYRLEDLNTLIEDLAQTNLAKLVDFTKPENNPLLQRRNVQLELLDRRIAFEKTQPETKDGARASNLEAMERERQKILEEYDRTVNKYKNDLAARIAKADLKTIDLQLNALNKALSSATASGNFDTVEALQRQIQKVLEKRKEAEIRNLEATTKEGDQRTEQRADLDNQYRQQLADVKSGDVFLATAEARAQRIEQIPLYQDYRQQGALEISGEAPSIADQVHQAQLKFTEYRSLIGSVKAKMDEYADTLDKLKAKHQEGTAEYEIEASKLAKTTLAHNAYNAQLGRVLQQLEDLNATPLSELNQISAGSIGARIAELPDALHKLNSNIETRVVNAVDGIADALSSEFANLIDNLLGLEDATQKAQAEFQALGDAQQRLADVTQKGLDVAEQISSIRQNETDPKRQEYLIQRALLAQQQAEELAQLQVQTAKSQYQEALNKDSVGGKIQGIFSELFGGIAKDFLKSSILGGFSQLFGLGGGAQPKGTWADPVTVQVKNAGLFSSNESTPLDGAGSLFKNLFGGIGNLFGSLGSLFGISNSTRDHAGALSAPTGNSGGGILGALSSLFSGINGLFSGTNAVSTAGSSYGVVGKDGGLFSGLLSGGGGGGYLGGIFSGLLSIAGTLINYFNSQDIPDQYIIQGQRYARGGRVRGPGTSTSDSVPIMASRDEYVLNAKAATAIGRDVLDAWNFGTQRPAHMAAGGMVSRSASAVNSRTQPEPAQSSMPGKAGVESLRVVLVDDQRKVGDYIHSPPGTKTMLDFVRKNSLPIRQILQG